ncbi:MAG: hypothetical protein IPN70_01890 [Candidatus Moraniibacteriota bacterium]|nr:MAG: hypothetical protein IPN70_01890 [Candidatus Moranbacteria bacterium]
MKIVHEHHQDMQHHLRYNGESHCPRRVQGHQPIIIEDTCLSSIGKDEFCQEHCLFRPSLEENIFFLGGLSFHRKEKKIDQALSS